MSETPEATSALLISCSPQVAEILKAGLQGAIAGDCAFAQAAGPGQALQLLEGQHFDLVFLSCRPPDKAAMAFLDQLRRSYPKSVAILVADRADPDSTVAFMKKGALDYLVQDDLPRIDFRPILHRAGEMRKLLNQNMEWSQLNEMKNEFIAKVSSDLRTPLAVILGYTRNLQEGSLGGLSADQLKAVSSITERAEQLLDMLNRILRVRASARGPAPAAFKPVDLGQLWSASVEKAKKSKAVKAKRLRVEYACPEAPVMVLADANSLADVCDNLLSNAVKFSAERGIVRLSVGASEAEAWAQVQDQGEGIAPDALPRVFDNFASANLRGRDRTGVGLGLALCRQTMELHGGRVWLESPGLGQGCTAHIALPLLRASAPEAPPLIEAAKKRILIVEDNLEFRDLIGRILSKISGDLELSNASSGDEALQAVSRQAPDLIILDIMMPDVSGLEVIMRLRETAGTSRIPILVLTGYPDAARRAQEVGAEVVLVKPVSHLTLVSKVIWLLQQGQGSVPAS